MSRDVQFCLGEAAALRRLLDDQRYEEQWRPRLKPDELDGTLTELLLSDRASVERVVQADAKRRVALLHEKSTKEGFLLALAAIRYCLQAAAILEGYNAWLAQRPNDPSLIVHAHRAHDHLYDDLRSLWPVTADQLSAWWS